MGTRPEAIKLVPVIRELKKRDMDVKVCVTAQHREMLDQVLTLFNVVPDFDLNIMKPHQDITDVTTQVLVGMRQVLGACRPDVVLVHGDTTTAMATALASFYQKIPVGHIEAGLRSGNRYSPWPEEINRQLVGTLSTLHFCPTESARQNLLKEGVDPSILHVTGNTVIDTLLEVNTRIEADAGLQYSLEKSLALEGRKMILVTMHRREHFGQTFENICLALKDIAQKDVQIVYPVHPNPNTREPAQRLLGGIENIHLIEPQEYLSFVYLIRRSFLILTDSGGLQEEAPSLHKPVLVVRNNTERPEGVEAGAVKLVGTERANIFRETLNLLENTRAYEAMTTVNNPYGDGHAAERIADILVRHASR